MKDDFHVDMSGRFYEGKNVGIAIVGTRTRIHYGCALKGNLIKLIQKYLFKEDYLKDCAKLYSICIYLLVRKVRNIIDSLIICNDEDFKEVKKNLLRLLGKTDFEIINITEFRKRLGKNVGSLADNLAQTYRKRALKPIRLSIGKDLNIVPISYELVEEYWKKLM